MKTLTKLIVKSAIAGGTFIGLGLLSAPAQAINLTYTFDNSVGYGTQSSFNQTVSGVTATFSGINSTGNTFYADGDGITLDFPGNFGNQFNISFDQAVKFLSYSVTRNNGIGAGQTATFDLSNPNGAGSTGNSLANLGNFDLSNQFTLNAGQTSTLAATFSILGNAAHIQSITVDATPVPWETDALPVVGTTILFGFGVWTKRKSAKSIQK